MRLPTVLLLLLLAPHTLQAGAWPRAPGEFFVSTSYTLTTGARTLIGATQDVRSYGSIYAEYGLTPKWTVGLDAGTGRGEEDRVSAALAFVRYPVWKSGGGQWLAANLGIGTLQDSDGPQSRVRPGLDWGRGFSSSWGDGWAGVETSVEWRHPSGDIVVKADLTAGLKPDDRWMLILQLQSGHYPGEETIVRLAPSVVRRLGAASHLQLGLVAPLAGDDAVGAKLATWFTF